MKVTWDIRHIIFHTIFLIFSKKYLNKIQKVGAEQLL